MTIQVSANPAADEKTPASRASYLVKLLSKQLPLRTDLPEATVNLLQQVRDRASVLLSEQTFPTTRQEDWRFTDLSPLTEVDFVAVSDQLPALDSSKVKALTLPEAETSHLVFLNGAYSAELSNVAGLPTGVIAGNLLEVAKNYPQLKNYLATQQGAEEVFTALNTASLTDAAVIWVPKNQTISDPIQLLFITASGAAAEISQPRCLVVVESSSSLTLIEQFASVGEAVYFTNAVTEIWVEENAQLNHTRVQRDSDAAFHIGKTAVSQARDSHYTCNAISFGATLSRHNLEVYQTGEQTETTLNGLTMTGREQLADTHSTIAYTKPYGISRQVHKCIVDDRSRTVFNGRVSVPKAAQLTNAAQLSSNLLLSPKARVDTKPQLEITADNVKCTHGATVSQLDGDEVFYLQSRGLDQESARKLLIYAFAFEVIDQIPVASVRDTLAQFVRKQL